MRNSRVAAAVIYAQYLAFVSRKQGGPVSGGVVRQLQRERSASYNAAARFIRSNGDGPPRRTGRRHFLSQYGKTTCRSLSAVHRKDTHALAVTKARKLTERLKKRHQPRRASPVDCERKETHESSLIPRTDLFMPPFSARLSFCVCQLDYYRRGIPLVACSNFLSTALHCALALAISFQTVFLLLLLFLLEIAHRLWQGAALLFLPSQKCNYHLALNCAESIALTEELKRNSSTSRNGNRRVCKPFPCNRAPKMRRVTRFPSFSGLVRFFVIWKAPRRCVIAQ